MKKIVFVCTGNVCRSPMAEALFNEFIKKEPSLSEFEAVSAGTFALEGAGATKESVVAMRDIYGIDITGHKARNLTKTDVNDAFLVLTMERSHKDYIMSMLPHSYKKVHTLKEYALDSPASVDIADPYAYPLETYKYCALEIAEGIEALIKKLKKNH